MSARADELRAAVIARALHGAGTTATAARAAAFANARVQPAAAALVGKVAANAWKITDTDVAAAQTAGLDDDAIFELVVCAALGQATRQLEAARAAITAAVDPAEIP